MLSKVYFSQRYLFQSNYNKIVLLVFRSLALISDRSRSSFWHQLKFTFWFAMASAARSNGTVNCGYIVFYLTSDTIEKLHAKKLSFVSLILRFLKAVIFCCLVVLPFAFFNWYGYIKFCVCSFVFHDLECDRPDWCNATLPSIYNHVQKDLWGLGLFSYYQLKKLPNFLLASPVVFLSFYSAYIYFTEHSHEILCLGMVTKVKKTRKSQYMFSSQNIFPFYIHLLFLVLFALLFMHVEVTTRMVMSSSPVIYWTVASFLTTDKNFASSKTFFDAWWKLGNTSKYCLYYFLGYFLLGILLHSNFYPWT